MCEYCYCNKQINNGFIGERLSNRQESIYIMKSEMPQGYYLVYYDVNWFTNQNGYKDYQEVFYRLVSINFCPICGAPLGE